MSSQATTEPFDQQQQQATSSGPSESISAPFSAMTVPNVAVMPSPVMNGPTPVSNPASNMHINAPQQPVVDPKLLNSLRTQIEFYFSPSNLARDRFLRSHFATYGGNVVPLVIICQFPKVQRICASYGFRAEPMLLQLAVDKSQVVNVSPNAAWIGPLSQLPPMDPTVQSRPKQNIMHPQPVMMNRSVSTGSNSGMYSVGVPIQQLKVNTNGSGNVTRNTSPASSQASAGNASASAVTNSTSGAVGEGGSSNSISSLDKKSHRTTVIIRDVPSDSATESILNAFTVDGVVPKSARPDVSNTWYITFSSESDAQTAIKLTKNGTIDGWPIKARIKSDSVAEGSNSGETSISQQGTSSMDNPSYPNVVTHVQPNRNVPITHLQPNAQYSHPYYRQYPQGNYSPHYPQVFPMQPNGIPVGAYPVPYGGGPFVPPTGAPRGYVINPNNGGISYRAEGGVPGPDSYRMTRKQSIGRKKKGHMNGIPRLDNLSHGGQSRSQGSKYDQDVTQPTFPQENSSVRQHLNNSKVGRGYQPRSHLSNNDTSEIGDSYSGNSNERNYSSKKKKGRKRDSFGGSSDAKERQGRASKEDKIEAPEILDSTLFPALSGMESLRKDERSSTSFSPNVGFSGYADALRQKKSFDIASTYSKDIKVESGNTGTIELEEKIDTLRISNLENEDKSIHFTPVPETIAVGALTGSAEPLEPAESLQVPEDAEGASIDNDRQFSAHNSTEHESTYDRRLEERNQSLDVSQDVTSTKNVTPKATDTDQTITPISSNEASPDMTAQPNSSWGSKRSFIDVVRKQA